MPVIGSAKPRALTSSRMSHLIELVSPNSRFHVCQSSTEPNDSRISAIQPFVIVCFPPCAGCRCGYFYVKNIAHGDDREEGASVRMCISRLAVHLNQMINYTVIYTWLEIKIIWAYCATMVI